MLSILVSAIVFVLGYIMYEIAKEDWYMYRYNSWLYTFLNKHDSKVSMLGIGFMVVSVTAILIWLMINV